MYDAIFERLIPDDEVKDTCMEQIFWGMHRDTVRVAIADLAANLLDEAL